MFKQRFQHFLHSHNLTPFNPSATWSTHGMSRELRAAGARAAPLCVLPVTTPQCKQPWLPCAGFYILWLTAPLRGRLQRRNITHHRRWPKHCNFSQLERVSPPRLVLLTTTGRPPAGAPDWGAMSRLDSFTWRCRQSLPPTRYSGTFAAPATTVISHKTRQQKKCSPHKVFQFHFCRSDVNAAQLTGSSAFPTQFACII